MEKLIETTGSEPIKILYINNVLPVHPNKKYISIDWWVKCNTDKPSLSKYINEKLKETGNENFTPNFIYIKPILKFKDYSGYKKIYATKAITSAELRIPMSDDDHIYGDLYVPDTELR